ncbi:hypothetical protein ACQ4PT_061830 [Festuca glaucescens]
MSSYAITAPSSDKMLPLFFVLLLRLAGSPRDAAALTRDDYPKGFTFGAGTSAYQDDVKLMQELGLDAYRFSIAWARLIPGIEPHVTIYHLDLPQSLQDEYGGLLSPRFVDDFTAYADACFQSFGDRVKHWVTLNEPNMEPISGYSNGMIPPQRCSDPFCSFVNFTKGNSTTEPYIAAHHLLLAHASAVSLYRDKYNPEEVFAPGALGKLLDHLKLKYGNPTIMIHENGLRDRPKITSEIVYDDDIRSEYLEDYLDQIYLSIGSRYGLCGVDMNAEERTRYVRKSARWYSGFLKGGELRPALPSGKAYLTA